MSTKKKLLFSLVGLILSITVFSSVVFAWFTISNTTGDFVIETGELKGDIKVESGAYNSGSGKYVWTEVAKQKAVDELFENIVPGQVITLKLSITNSATSNVDANYSCKFGTITYNSGSGYQPFENGNEKETDFQNAIKIMVSPAFTSDAEATDAAIQALPIIQGPDNFAAVPEAKNLYFYNDSHNKVFAEAKGENVIKPSQTHVIVIKIYFDPEVYGVGENDANSNDFMNKGFSIDGITVELTQEQKLIQ